MILPSSQSLRTHFKGGEFRMGEIVTYGVEDSHAIRDRARERIAKARAAREYVIIIGLPSDIYTLHRGSRVGRLRSGSHARHTGERKGNNGERGRKKRECFYCSTSRLKVAFPGQWADPLKLPCLVVDNAT